MGISKQIDKRNPYSMENGKWTMQNFIECRMEKGETYMD